MIAKSGELLALELVEIVQTFKIILFKKINQLQLEHIESKG